MKLALRLVAHLRNMEILSIVEVPMQVRIEGVARGGNGGLLVYRMDVATSLLWHLEIVLIVMPEVGFVSQSLRTQLKPSPHLLFVLL